MRIIIISILALALSGCSVTSALKGAASAALGNKPSVSAQVGDNAAVKTEEKVEQTVKVKENSGTINTIEKEETSTSAVKASKVDTVITNVEELPGWVILLLCFMFYIAPNPRAVWRDLRS